MDFSDLKSIKRWLGEMFDHTFLCNEDDPELSLWKELNRRDLIQLRILPNCGMEGTAKFVFEYVQDVIDQKTNGRVWLYSVEVRENQKNSAIYINE